MGKSDKVITEAELPEVYEKVKTSHAKHLAKHGVKLPKLKDSKGNFTKNAIVLCLLAKYIKKPISKATITENVRQWHGQDDMQQARHLARQSGWYIESGMRGDTTSAKLKKDEYRLLSLSRPYPAFRKGGHRAARGGTNFIALKKKYDNRCATCGSPEGEANFINPARITKLQSAHMNPTKDLTMDNMIPQCQECNQAYRDWFIFDGNGRVTDINIKSPRWRKKYRLAK